MGFILAEKRERGKSSCSQKNYSFHKSDHSRTTRECEHLYTDSNVAENYISFSVFIVYYFFFLSEVVSFKTTNIQLLARSGVNTWAIVLFLK